MQEEILTKITILLTENIEAVIPDLPIMKDKVDEAILEIEKAATGGGKTFNIAAKCREDIDAIQGEFEYMKTRFSPQFVQRVDKAVSSLQTIAFDIDLIKMTTSHAAMKKDLDVLE